MVLLAMSRRNMENIADTPSGFPLNGKKEDKLAWLHALSLEILDFCNKPLPKADIQVASRIIKDPLHARTLSVPGEEDPLAFCICAAGSIFSTCNVWKNIFFIATINPLLVRMRLSQQLSLAPSAQAAPRKAVDLGYIILHTLIQISYKILTNRA